MCACVRIAELSNNVKMEAFLHRIDRSTETKVNLLLTATVCEIMCVIYNVEPW